MTSDPKRRYRLGNHNKALVYDDPRGGHKTGEMILVGAGSTPLKAAAQACAALNTVSEALEATGPGRVATLDDSIRLLQNLAQLVVEARTTADISQRQLGREVGLPMSTISRCEGGHGMTVGTAVRLLEWLRWSTRGAGRATAPAQTRKG